MQFDSTYDVKKVERIVGIRRPYAIRWSSLQLHLGDFYPLILIHSLPKVKHGEENANFRKPIRIEKDEIRFRSRWKYANMLGNTQLRFHVK